jgi:hypothetical protein
VVRHPEVVGDRPAVILTVAARRAAGAAVGLLAAIPTVAARTVVVRTVAAASRPIHLADSILGVSGSSRWSPS